MPILVIQHSNTGTAATIGDAIIRHGLRCQTIRLASGDSIPSDLDGIDGIISMGSSDSATDDSLPWIAPELALLKAACVAQLPVLGVCLGAQLLARALGGSVSKMSTRPSVGLCRIDLTTAGRDDPLFRGLPWYGSWPSWHADEISELPPDARLLAKSEECGIEAFAHGIFAYGVQFHPEWTAHRVAELCDDSADHLAGDGFDYAAVKAAALDEADSIERMARRFSENVASYLMPVERVNAGIPKDIHH
jgi:GMP synthase (glutamine-hydrolysing)